MNKKLVGLFVLICVLIGVSRKYNLFSMNESDIQKVKEYHERLKAAQEDSKAQEKLREYLEKVGTPVRRLVKQSGRCPLGKEFVSFLLDGGPIALQSSGIYSVAFSPDSSKLATGSYNHDAKLWDVNTGDLLYTFGGYFFGHRRPVKSVAFSPDGSKLATGSWDKTAKLWDVATGNSIHTFTGHTSRVHSVAFSPDGSKIATGSEDLTVKIWDINTGQLLRTLAGPNGHTSEVHSVAFSPDGSKLATGSSDKTAKLWDVNTGQLLHLLVGPNGHTDRVYSVAFSPDGSKLATGSWDKTAKLWDVNTGQLLRTVTTYSGGINSVAFSPDGSKLATGSWDETAKLWDVNTGQLLYTFAGHTAEVYSVALSPDGSKLVTGSWGRPSNIWNILRINKLTELRAKERKEKGKNLTKEPTISLQRFLKVLPNKECEKDPEYCNIMSVEQCELLQAFENTFKKDQAGRPVGRIQATQAQWQTFKTLPEVLQEILRVRIKEPVEFVYQ